MTEAIEHQVLPFDKDVHEPIAGVVHIVSWRSRAEELSLGGEVLLKIYPGAVGLVLGLDPDIVVGKDVPSLTRREDTAHHT